MFPTHESLTDPRLRITQKYSCKEKNGTLTAGAKAL